MISSSSWRFDVEVAMDFLSALFILLYVVTAASPQVRAESDTLRLVHILYRHGDRTPLRSYPKDPYKDVEKHWPTGPGQLTDEGKEKHLKLGQFNRKRYEHFMSDAYVPDEILIQSTDVKRTVESAEYHLFGLYPSQPLRTIPVQQLVDNEDPVLSAFYSLQHCPRYRQLHAINRQSPLIAKMSQDNKETIDYLREHTGLDFTDKIFEDAVFLNDILTIELQHNKTLPEWTSKVFPHPIKDLTNFAFAHFMAPNTQMRRLRGGPWVKELVDHMKDYAQSALVPSNRKMFMYSAHDITLATALSALDVFNNIQPPIAAMVLIELHELSPRQFFVKVLYKNVSDISVEPFTLTVPGCEEMCPLDNFVQLKQQVISPDVREECNNPLK